MEVGFSRRFLKQLAELPPDIRTKIETFAFDRLPHAASLHQIGGVEKLKGYDGCYKVRFGSYRVGLRHRNDKDIVLVTVMHRREIYRFFP